MHLRCWICRRIGSTEARCSQPQASTDAKEMLPSVTAAVAGLDKQLKELHPEQMSQLLTVSETPLGVVLQTVAAAAVVQSANGNCWTAGDVIVSCNGLPVESKADLLRAMRFCDSQAVLLTTVAAASLKPWATAPLASEWVRTDTASGRGLHENTRTRQVLRMHPQLHLKAVSQMLVSLASYNSGNNHPFYHPTLSFVPLPSLQTSPFILFRPRCVHVRQPRNCRSTVAAARVSNPENSAAARATQRITREHNRRAVSLQRSFREHSQIACTASCRCRRRRRCAEPFWCCCWRCRVRGQQLCCGQHRQPNS